jgi:hypothetical protein
LPLPVRKSLKPTLTSSPPRSATGTLGLLTLGLAGSFLTGVPLMAATGNAMDPDGQRTDTFGTIIYTTSASSPEAGEVHASADSLACVIDVYERMGLEQFPEAYQQVARAKHLKKTPPLNLGGPVYITATLGIIFAIQAAVPVEKFAEELERLNAQTPSEQWPDMVVVLSAWIINYAVQFPGAEIEGDFLVPPKQALSNNLPPFYVVTVMKPTGTQTFNKMFAFLIGHLTVFSPGANLPDRLAVLEGVPDLAITLSGYQCDLNGQLVPVPRQFYRDRYLAPPPLRIEDRQGQLLRRLANLLACDISPCLAQHSHNIHSRSVGAHH